VGIVTITDLLRVIVGATELLEAVQPGEGTQAAAGGADLAPYWEGRIQCMLLQCIPANSSLQACGLMAVGLPVLMHLKFTVTTLYV